MDGMGTTILSYTNRADMLVGRPVEATLSPLSLSTSPPAGKSEDFLAAAPEKAEADPGWQLSPSESVSAHSGVLTSPVPQRCVGRLRVRPHVYFRVPRAVRRCQDRARTQGLSKEEQRWLRFRSEVLL